jgi:hypothetical protein
MSTDEQARVIEHLDFAVRCESAKADAATVSLICRGCGHTVLLCDGHLDIVRRIAVDILAQRGHQLRSVCCDERGVSLEVLFRIVAL